MHYVVGLLLEPDSQEADLKDIVRATDVEDAISVFVKYRNIKYAYSAYAYPARKSGPFTKQWRWQVQSSVSGRVSMLNKE